MKKQEFLSALKRKLSGLPRQDICERINFYSEMIDDRIEEGLNEEQAVSEMGSADNIAAQITSEVLKNNKEKVKTKRRPTATETVLLVLGSPVWLSLVIAAFAVVLSLVAVLWSVILSLWAVFAALAVSSPVGIILGLVYTVSGNGVAGVALCGTALVCAGLAVFLFFGCVGAVKGGALITAKLGSGIKKCFVKREVA